MPAVAFSSSPNAPITVQFLSSDGVFLPGDCSIDPEAPTFFVVHGFRDKGTSDASLRQADAVRRWSPGANVIVVSWHVPSEPQSASFPPQVRWPGGLGTIAGGLIALDKDYRRAVEAAKQVAKEMAEWMKEKGIPPSKTVISGHSLGAQIAAFTSNECARPELFNEPIAAILAADPAGPQFEDRPPEERLEKDDAGQVIVVHATKILGDESPIGTVDIYVSWPESEQSDCIRQHSQARELVTKSFLRSEMSNTDGTPFGANGLGFDFGDGKPRDYQPDTESTTDLALRVPREEQRAPSRSCLSTLAPTARGRRLSEKRCLAKGIGRGVAGTVRGCGAWVFSGGSVPHPRSARLGHPAGAVRFYVGSLLKE